MNICFTVALLLLVTSVIDGHRPTLTRTPYRPYGPATYRYKFTKLAKKIEFCSNKYVCGLKTYLGMCEPECIERTKLCDNVKDCLNGQDELGCEESPQSTCAPCKQSTSAPCEQSTPAPCPECELACPPLEFNCIKNGERVCYPLSFWCDQISNCDNDVDETDCPTICDGVRCSTDQTKCAVLCDGVPECPADSFGFVDDEPEVNCKCRIDTTSPTFCRSSVPAGASLEYLADWGFELNDALAACRTWSKCNAIKKDASGVFYYPVSEKYESAEKEVCSASSTHLFYSCQYK